MFEWLKSLFVNTKPKEVVYCCNCKNYQEVDEKCLENGQVDLVTGKTNYTSAYETRFGDCYGFQGPCGISGKCFIPKNNS